MNAYGARPRVGLAAAMLFGLCAVYQFTLGLYFVQFRPPLLPEDLRFLGVTAGTLGSGLPELARWLDLVFIVMGGQMAAVGALTGVFVFRLARGKECGGLELGLLALAGAMSTGLMGWVNFVLGSDFRWLLVVPILAWASGTAMAAYAARTPLVPGRPAKAP